MKEARGPDGRRDEPDADGSRFDDHGPHAPGQSWPKNPSESRELRVERGQEGDICRGHGTQS